jgi:hypothetical protein
MPRSCGRVAGTRVVSMVEKKRYLNIPKEDEKSKDVIVLSRLKVPYYSWRGVGTIRLHRQSESDDLHTDQ